jgi:N-acetylmuramoyl-L-alanine amidase
LASKGFGNWYGDTSKVQVNPGFKNLDALKMIGYDVHDSTSAIRAFRLHFLQDTVSVLDAPAQKILYALYIKL